MVFIQNREQYKNILVQCMQKRINFEKTTNYLVPKDIALHNFLFLQNIANKGQNPLIKMSYRKNVSKEVRVLFFAAKSDRTKRIEGEKIRRPDIMTSSVVLHLITRLRRNKHGTIRANFRPPRNVVLKVILKCAGVIQTLPINTNALVSHRSFYHLSLQFEFFASHSCYYAYSSIPWILQAIEFWRKAFCAKTTAQEPLQIQDLQLSGKNLAHFF